MGAHFSSPIDEARLLRDALECVLETMLSEQRSMPQRINSFSFIGHLLIGGESRPHRLANKHWISDNILHAMAISRSPNSNLILPLIVLGAREEENTWNQRLRRRPMVNRHGWVMYVIGGTNTADALIEMQLAHHALTRLDENSSLNPNMDVEHNNVHTLSHSNELSSDQSSIRSTQSRNIQTRSQTRAHIVNAPSDPILNANQTLSDHIETNVQSQAGPSSRRRRSSMDSINPRPAQRPRLSGEVSVGGQRRRLNNRESSISGLNGQFIILADVQSNITGVLNQLLDQLLGTPMAGTASPSRVRVESRIDTTFDFNQFAQSLPEVDRPVMEFLESIAHLVSSVAGDANTPKVLPSKELMNEKFPAIPFQSSILFPSKKKFSLWSFLFPSKDQEQRDTFMSKCMICLDVFKEDDHVRVLNCSHGFHMDCIDEWVCDRVNHCPLCRKVAIELE